MPPQIAFVTGASSGFGEAIARRYAAAGTKVVAAARRGDRLDALVAEFGDRGDPSARARCPGP